MKIVFPWPSNKQYSCFRSYPFCTSQFSWLQWQPFSLHMLDYNCWVISILWTTQVFHYHSIGGEPGHMVHVSTRFMCGVSAPTKSYSHIIQAFVVIQSVATWLLKPTLASKQPEWADVCVSDLDLNVGEWGWKQREPWQWNWYLDAPSSSTVAWTSPAKMFSSE